MDGSLKKAKLYLGEPDKYVHPFGHITKDMRSISIRFQITASQKFSPILKNEWQFWATMLIEEIYVRR